MDRGGGYLSASFLLGTIFSAVLENVSFRIFPIICSILLLVSLLVFFTILYHKHPILFTRSFQLTLVCSILFMLGSINFCRTSNSAKSPYSTVMESKVGSIRKNIKETAINTLAKIIPNTQDCAVVVAFTLGDKSLLDHKTKQAYQVSGAIHVLALSGLHIGIIYNLLNYLLFFLNFHHTSKLLKLLICACCIFSYAVLTGFGPSVQRAAIMILVWKVLAFSNRKSGKWDVFLLSACIIILIDPNEIKSIGFQLSYAATAGIIAIYPTLEAAFGIYRGGCLYKYLKPVWSMISISIACQVSTAPLILYYFGSIPFYFLITNLAAIPLVTISLYTIVLSLVTSEIPIIGHISEFLMQKSVHLLNFIIKYIGNGF